MSTATDRNNEWATAAVRRAIVRALLCAAAEFERLAELEARRA